MNNPQNNFEDICCRVCNKKTEEGNPLIRVRGEGMVHEGCLKETYKTEEKVSSLDDKPINKRSTENWREKIVEQIGLATYGGVSFEPTGAYREKILAIIEPLIETTRTEEREKILIEIKEELEDHSGERVYEGIIEELRDIKYTKSLSNPSTGGVSEAIGRIKFNNSGELPDGVK